VRHADDATHTPSTCNTINPLRPLRTVRLKIFDLRFVVNL